MDDRPFISLNQFSPAYRKGRLDHLDGSEKDMLDRSVANDDVGEDDWVPGDDNIEDVADRDMTVEDVAVEDVAVEGIADEDVADEDTADEDVAVEDVTDRELTEGDRTPGHPTTPTRRNVEPAGEYYHLSTQPPFRNPSLDHPSTDPENGPSRQADVRLSLSQFESLSIQNILTGTVEFIRHHLNADRVIFHLLKATRVEPPEEDSPIFAEAVSPLQVSMAGSAAREAVPIACIQGLMQQCSQSNRPPFLSIPVAHAPMPLQSLWEHYQVQSALLVPLVHGDYLVGLFAIHQCSHSRTWTEREFVVLQSMLHDLNIILLYSQKMHRLEQENAQLVSSLQKRTEQVQTAIQFESSLKRITDKVRDSLDEGKILQTAVQELSEVLGLGGCNAALYNLAEGTSTICYEYTNFIAASRGRVAQMNNFPEIYNQLRNGMYFQFCSLIPNPKRGRVSLLACPIFFAEQDSHDDTPQDVLGDLWLIHTEDYVFSEFEIRLVQQVANQCAIAIRQARLYQAVQAQVKELERLNRLKDEFLSTVSHELRTPISNVKMAIHMLKSATDEERKQRYMEILDAESKREADLINDLLDLQKLESANFPIHVETVQLQHWLSRVAEPFLSRMVTHQQVFNLHCAKSLETFSTDFNLLQRILSELLNNACKYTPGEGSINLSADPATPHSTDPTTHVVTIKVRNQAQIPPEELPHIFDKFYRVPNADPWKQGGTGLGLALVQKLVHQLDGTIQVESQDGWTTFTVTIPYQLNVRSAS